MPEFAKKVRAKITATYVLGALVALFFLTAFAGFWMALQSRQEDELFDQKSQLAEETNAAFQLAISKGKNFAILKDDLNRSRALAYFKKAQDLFSQLTRMEQDPPGREMLYRLGAGIQSVQFQLGILTSTAQKSDSAEKLYNLYLKNITIDFDNASQAYIEYIDEKDAKAQADLSALVQFDLVVVVLGVLLALGVMGIGYSITADLRQALKNETALLDEERRFRALTETAYDAILNIDDEGTVVYASPAVQAIFGYGTHEMTGKSIAMILSEKSRPGFLDSVVGYLKNQKEGLGSRVFEFEGLHREGRALPLEGSFGEFGRDGRLFFTAVFRDVTERQKMEKAFKESEERFRLFSELSREGIVIHEKGTIMDVNQAALDMLGYGAPEVIGKDVVAFLDVESAQRALKRRQAGYPDSRFEGIAQRKDGTRFPVEIDGKPFELNGRQLRVIRVWDLTERKKAEQALRQSEENFRTLIERAPDAILVNRDRKIIYVNKRCLDLLGYGDRESLSQKDPLEIVHLDDRPKVTQRIQNALLGGENPSLEIRVVRRDGSLVDVESTSVGIQFEERSSTMVILRDITERRRAESELENRERYYRALIENIQDVITVLDFEGNQLFASPAQQKVIGYSPEEMQGKAFRDFIHPQDLPAVLMTFQSLIENPGKVNRVKYRFRHKNGNWVACESIGKTFMSGGQECVIVANRDVTEREKAEQALVESEERYRLLVESSPEGVVVNDENILYVNPAGVGIFGASNAGDLVGRPLLNFVPAEEKTWALDTLLKTAGKNQPAVPVERKILRPDGKVIDILCSSIPFDYQGKKAVLTLFSDISERKIAEKKLWESEERFHSIFDHSPMGIGLVALDSTVVLSNPKFCEMSGYTRQELVGQSCHAITYPSDIETDVKYLSRLAEGEISHYAIEKRYVRKDGSILWAYLIGALVRDDSGKPVYQLAMVEDLTARKQAEAAVRESQERYRSLVESMQNAVMVHDEDKILYVNPWAVTIFGARDEEDLLGKPYLTVVPPEFHEDVRRRIRATIENGTRNELTERKLKRLDGTPLDVLVTSVPFYDRGRRVVLAIFLDITALKEAERKAQRYQRLAALGELAAGMAHEIRNPTAAISAQAQYLLKKTKEASPSYEQLKDILQQCDRLDTLIHDTLDYSPEKKFEERTEIPAKKLFQKALWLAQTQFGPNHKRTHVDIEMPGNIPPLRVHPTRMERVLVNLILNAFQAMPEGGNLLLKADQLENATILRVEDDGKGVSVEEMARLFEPFYTSRKMGSGLGLTICQKIVEEHQGRIRVELVQPHGTAFIIELPLEKEAVS